MERLLRTRNASDAAVAPPARGEGGVAGARDRKRLAVALHATGAGIFEYDVAAGRAAYCSERFAEILGCTVAELPVFDELLAWLIDRIHTDDRAHVEAACRGFVEGGQTECGLEFRVRRGEDGFRDVTCWAEAQDRDAMGRAATIVGALLDRSEQAHMEEQLRRAQRMEAVGRLAGGVAHDFNNLLTVILNFGEFVAEQLAPGTAVHEDMCEVLSAARRAEELTRQLLTFSRRQPADLKIVNLNELVGDTDKMLRRLLGEDVEYSTHLAAGLWDVRVDPGSLEQVLVNLAINGRDAMANGGQLTIETSNVHVGEQADDEPTEVPPGHYVVVSVSDDGVGMDAATQARIFEPFFTTKGPDNGTGLGLATCYGIVKQSDGFIVVRSQPGEGTTFRVYLPRACADAPTVDDAPKTAAGSVDSILVVEDETVVRNLIVRVLSQFEYTVLQAANGAEALAIAEATDTHIRLVLTDVVMPEMNGPQLVERLKPGRPDLKILYMSGYTRGALDIADEAILVDKPFSPETLAGSVRDALSAGD